MAQCLVRLGALGMALLFAAPALAQSIEPPARRAAAIADARQTCAPGGDSISEIDRFFLDQRDADGSTSPAGQYGLLGEQGLRQRVRNATYEETRYGPRLRVVRCVAEVALRHVLSGVPGYDHGVSSSRPSAPTSRPNVAAQPPVSKPAMSAEEARGRVAEDAVVKAVEKWVARHPKIEPCKWRSGEIQDPCMKSNSERGIIGSKMALASLKARRREFSPELYQSLKETFEKPLALSRQACADLAVSTTPCDPKMWDDGVRQPQLTQESKNAVPPLRPTLALEEAHNPAGEATDCVRVIYEEDFEVEHVSTTQKAAFRNRCSRAVEVTWCTLTDDCRPGYTNLATVPARKDRGFSYEPSVRGSKVAFAACYNGFVRNQGGLSKKLLHACK